MKLCTTSTASSVEMGQVEVGVLVCCNTCPCVTYSKCIDIPSHSHKTILAQDITFRCSLFWILQEWQNATQYWYKVEKVIWDLLLQCHWSHFVMVITNHIDNNYGDLFTGYISNQYIAAEVDQFLDLLMAPWSTMI
ncbi:hypothetical protein EDD22DRAFT_848225 [Suillus occidentalis]|nr:hypothetical protein EDD22DRAFT_848225 [Suillus occidentalis]